MICKSTNAVDYVGVLDHSNTPLLPQGELGCVDRLKRHGSHNQLLEKRGACYCYGYLLPDKNWSKDLSQVSFPSDVAIASPSLQRSMDRVSRPRSVHAAIARPICQQLRVPPISDSASRTETKLHSESVLARFNRKVSGIGPLIDCHCSNRAAFSPSPRM